MMNVEYVADDTDATEESIMINETYYKTEKTKPIARKIIPHMSLSQITEKLKPKNTVERSHAIPVDADYFIRFNQTRS